MNAEDLCYTPAIELARLIREKAISPVEVTRTLLERIEAINPKLNAYCTLTGDAAMDQARSAENAVMRGGVHGPLLGVPYSVKDLLITKGVRTMRGSRIHAEFVPGEDTPPVERLRAAGGIMLGKTATPEFGWKGVTDSPLTGITRNPWNTGMTPGGSSGGAAAQIASGLGPLAIGTDGGGSIRIPAGFAGVFGLKPSYGRVPVYPASHHDLLSHAGPLTRTVADAALMLKVMAGPDPRDRLSLEAPPEDYPAVLARKMGSARFAWSPDLGYARVHPEVARICSHAARVFEELGCTVEEVNPGFGDPAPYFGTLYRTALAGGLRDAFPQWKDKMDPGLVDLYHKGEGVTGVEFVQAQIARHQFCDRVRRFFEDYDFLLTPTLAVPAFPAGQLAPDPEETDDEAMWAWTPFSYPFNLTGQPAASLPAGFTSDGLPVGLQVVGRRFDDAGVLRVSAAFEEARPWAGRRPAL
ncbi:MAG: amidase [SAR324 cluster bacterium]|nr:amidase [SAR324 cluster bacterium]MCH8887994.1 amidase [SAR324 cluster bacterium]